LFFIIVFFEFLLKISFKRNIYNAEPFFYSFRGIDLFEYTVLDLETTGLSRERHKITEIAALKYDFSGNLLEEFHSLVNPECRIPSFITRLTGITDEMVQDSPKIHEILPDFVNFLGDSVIVAHNATFDYGFLNHNSCKHLEKPLNNSCLCTRRLASRILYDLPSKKLSVICEYFDIVNTQAHRAMADTVATSKIFTSFRKTLSDINLNNKEELLKFQTIPIARSQKLLNGC